VRGFYRGITRGLQTYVPFVGIYWLAYEDLKRRAHSDALLSFMACGFAAGGFAATVTTPLDVLKTRTQTAAQHEPRPSLRSILRADGVRAFTRGMSARVLWIAPASAITIGVYEKALLWIERDRL